MLFTLNNGKTPVQVAKGAPLVRRGNVRSVKARHILSAAQSVFVSEGFAAFGLRRVAQAANLSLGTLQYYYPTIEDLLVATVGGLLRGFNDEIVAIVDSGDPADARLEGMVECVLKQVRRADTARLTFETLAVAQRETHARRAIADTYNDYRVAVSRIVAEIRPDLSSKRRMTTATLICAQLDGLLLFAYPDGPPEPDWDDLGCVVQRAVWALIRSA